MDSNQIIRPDARIVVIRSRLLIPVGYGAVKAGVVPVPSIAFVLFDESLEAACQGNAVRNVEPADGGMAVPVDGHGVQIGVRTVKPREGRLGSPGIADAVLAYGAEGGGETPAADKEFLIPFAPPPVDCLPIPGAISPGSGLLLRRVPGVKDMQMNAGKAAVCAMRQQQRPAVRAGANRAASRRLKQPRGYLAWNRSVPPPGTRAVSTAALIRAVCAVPPRLTTSIRHPFE